MIVEIVTVLYNQYELNAKDITSSITEKLSKVLIGAIFKCKAHKFCMYCIYSTHIYGPPDASQSNTNYMHVYEI